MEHIMQIAISVDDETIKQRVAERAETEILGNLKKDIERTLFEKRAYYYPECPLEAVVKAEVQAICEENKAYILDKAATILAEKLVRSKAGKAILGDLKGEEK